MLAIPFSVQADSSQSNFTVSPPPVPWFEFEKGQTDLKAGANYVSVSGEGVSLKGAGVLTFWRHAFTNVLAIDAGISTMYLKGRVTGFDMNFLTINVPADLEIQVLKTNRTAMLLFGGINLGESIGSMSYSYAGGGGDKESADVTTYLRTYGLVAGIQASLKISDFAVSPFFIFQRIAGKTETNIAYSDRSGGSTSVKMPTYISKTFGIDIAYKPWEIVLSSMLQMIPGTGGNSKINTYVFTLTHDFQFGINKNKEEEPNREENKTEAE